MNGRSGPKPKPCRSNKRKPVPPELRLRYIQQSSGFYLAARDVADESAPMRIDAPGGYRAYKTKRGNWH